MNKVTPCLWFDGNGEEAARFYAGLFANSKVSNPASPTPEGAKPPVMVTCTIAGQDLLFLNGGPHYTLSPAFSLSVNCADQAEVDRYWDALIADGGEESMCGWLVDRFGVSWQIVPQRLIELMSDPDRAKAQRVTEAMLKMKRIIVADLEAAHAGN